MHVGREREVRKGQSDRKFRGGGSEVQVIDHTSEEPCP